MIFALAEQGELPAWFGRIHPRYHTPANAVLFTSIVATALALSGSFARLALVAALAKLIMYAGCAAATLELRRRSHGAQPARFVIPGGPIVPVIALAVSIGIGFGATREQLLGGFVALAAGGLLYAVAPTRQRQLRITN
jgi:amino acid transporter